MSMRRWTLALALWGMWVTSAQAELFLCGDANGLTRFFFTDPTSPEASTPGCVQVPKAATTAQRTLLTTYPLRYLRVVGGLVELLSPAEQQAVDTALANAAAAQAALKAALEAEANTDNDFCNPTSLADLTTKINTFHTTRETAITTMKTNAAAQIAANKATTQAQIDALAAANLTTLKAGLTALNDLLASTATDLNTMIAANDKDLNDADALIAKKLARCLYARRLLRQ
jgi:hypothetical protein